MGQFILTKRWRLNAEYDEHTLIRLVQEQITPHYTLLSTAVELGLWHVHDTRDYLALQYWQSRVAWQAATQCAEYAQWFTDYLPILEQWDKMMALVDEWESDELL